MENMKKGHEEDGRKEGGRGKEREDGLGKERVSMGRGRTKGRSKKICIKAMMKLR